MSLYNKLRHTGQEFFIADKLNTEDLSFLKVLNSKTHT